MFQLSVELFPNKRKQVLHFQAYEDAIFHSWEGHQSFLLRRKLASVSALYQQHDETAHHLVFTVKVKVVCSAFLRRHRMTTLAPAHSLAAVAEEARDLSCQLLNDIRRAGFFTGKEKEIVVKMNQIQTNWSHEMLLISHSNFVLYKARLTSRKRVCFKPVLPSPGFAPDPSGHQRVGSGCGSTSWY